MLLNESKVPLTPPKLINKPGISIAFSLIDADDSIINVFIEEVNSSTVPSPKVLSINPLTKLYATKPIPPPISKVLNTLPSPPNDLPMRPKRLSPCLATSLGAAGEVSCCDFSCCMEAIFAAFS